MRGRYRWIRSPLGTVVDNRWFEEYAAESLPGLWRVARAGAAASNTLGEGADAFVAELAPERDLSWLALRRVPRALRRFARHHEKYQESEALWESAFFGQGGGSEGFGGLRGIDNVRRRRAEKISYPFESFGFLRRERAIAPVRDRVHSPDELLLHWADEIWRPERLYFAPSVRMRFETSRSFVRGGHREYLIRFTSPSRFLNDRVHARVFEPLDGEREIPTVIFGGGLGMAYDQARFWPEEGSVGRRLSERGCRVALIESPWHGRRAPQGLPSGELPIATSPLGIMLLLATQVQETAALVHWARTLGSLVVAVGGTSISALAAEHVAGRCGAWPESLRPDAIFLVSGALDVAETGLRSRLLELLDIAGRIRDAGWEDPYASMLGPVLDPPERSSLVPDRHHVVLGRRDEFLPYASGVELVRKWRIPEANVVTWDVGHLGLPVRLLRTDEVQDQWLSMLNAIGKAKTKRRIPVERWPRVETGASYAERRDRT